MDAVTHFSLLARYNVWATARLLAAVQVLPEADYRRDMGLFFRSIHGTLNHLLVGEHLLWFARFAEGASPRMALDAEVEALVQRKSPSLQVQIKNLKKQKLAVKEEIYNMLQQAQPILALKQQKNYMDQAKLAEMSGVRLSA